MRSDQQRTGETLRCLVQETEFEYSRLEDPQALDLGVCAFRVRDESSELARAGAARAVDCHVILVRPGSDSRNTAWENFSLLRGPDLWDLYQTGRVVGGPWDGWWAAVGEPWTQSLLDSTRLDPPELNTLYEQVFCCLLRLHDQGFVHGALQPASIVRCDQTRAWKLLPPLERSDATPADDVARFAALLCRQLGVKPNERPFAGPGYAKMPLAWKSILNGCLNPDPAERWTAGRALFGEKPVPVPYELTVAPEGDNRLISWPPTTTDGVPFGEPVLYELGQHAAVPIGTVRGVEWLEQFHATSLGVENPTRICRPVAGRRFQLVNRVENQIVVFGSHISLSELPEVEELRLMVRRGWLHGSWTWPDGVNAADLVVRFDRYPTSRDDAVQVWRVRRPPFESVARHKWEFEGMGSRTLYAAVFVVGDPTRGGASSTGAAPGCRWTGPAVHHRVDYELVLNVLNRRKLKLKSRSPGAGELQLPRLVLAAKKGYSPRELTQSSKQWDLPHPLALPADESLLVDLPDYVFKGPRMVGRLFTRDERDSAWLELASNPPQGLHFA
jgi:hypothetical protein